jgi:hypothetical protein
MPFCWVHCISGAVVPVVHNVDHAGDSAKRGKRLEHMKSHWRILPRLTKHQTSKHEGVFKPLVWPHQTQQGEWSKRKV